jgi:hypothetical protein
MTGEAQEDLVLAVSEAAGNSVEHAYLEPTASGTVELVLWTEPGAVCVEVIDHGEWRTQRKELRERGRGILVMRGLMESVHIDYGPGGTRVLLRLAVQDRVRDRVRCRVDPSERGPLRGRIVSRLPASTLPASDPPLVPPCQGRVALHQPPGGRAPARRTPRAARARFRPPAERSRRCGAGPPPSRRSQVTRRRDGVHQRHPDREIGPEARGRTGRQHPPVLDPGRIMELPRPHPHRYPTDAVDRQATPTCMSGAGNGSDLPCGRSEGVAPTGFEPALPP